MKTRLKKSPKQPGAGFTSSHQRKSLAQAEFEDRRDSSALQHSVMRGVDNSPLMTMQRKQFEPSFGNPVQREEMDEEELMQGKFDTVQCQDSLEDEEMLQGKFKTLQRQGLEEEELMQGKFDSCSVSQRRKNCYKVSSTACNGKKWRKKS